MVPTCVCVWKEGVEWGGAGDMGERGVDLAIGGQRRERASHCLSFKCFLVFEAHKYRPLRINQAVHQSIIPSNSNNNNITGNVKKLFSNLYRIIRAELCKSCNM